MTEQKKIAYRNMLFQSFLIIRSYKNEDDISDSEKIKKQKNLLIKHFELANWIHNLANYSAKDFDGFNEQWFWDCGRIFKHTNPAEYNLLKKSFGVDIAK